jgi:hypothetical protein
MGSPSTDKYTKNRSDRRSSKSSEDSLGMPTRLISRNHNRG